jgi:hypothetical protein
MAEYPVKPMLIIACIWFVVGYGLLLRQYPHTIALSHFPEHGLLWLTIATLIGPLAALTFTAWRLRAGFTKAMMACTVFGLGVTTFVPLYINMTTFRIHMVAAGLMLVGSGLTICSLAREQNAISKCISAVGLVMLAVLLSSLGVDQKSIFWQLQGIYEIAILAVMITLLLRSREILSHK